MKTSDPQTLEAVYYWEKMKKMSKTNMAKTLWKTLDISSATARVASHVLKALAILLDTTIRRSSS